MERGRVGAVRTSSRTVGVFRPYHFEAYGPHSPLQERESTGVSFLYCKQNQFDNKAGTTARVIETLMFQYFD